MQAAVAVVLHVVPIIEAKLVVWVIYTAVGHTSRALRSARVDEDVLTPTDRCNSSECGSRV